jgi:glycosyltransferase involved in cell wall biosynthesis
MPLLDTPWEQGKCGYKLIQYMACGLPVVASPIGANRRIVREGQNGYLPTSGSEWHDGLEMLLVDPALRQKFGSAGRNRVEKEYCIKEIGPRLIELMRSAAGN